MLWLLKAKTSQINISFRLIWQWFWPHQPVLSHTSKYIALCIYFHIDIDFFSIEFAAIYASEYSNYIAWDWENKIDNNKNFPLISHWFRWNCYLLGSKLHRLIRIFWGISQPQRLQSSQYPLDRLVCSTLHILDCVCQQPKYHFAYARAHSNSARVRKTQLCAFACTQSETMERKEKKKSMHFKSIIHLTTISTKLRTVEIRYD